VNYTIHGVAHGPGPHEVPRGPSPRHTDGAPRRRGRGPVRGGGDSDRYNANEATGDAEVQGVEHVCTRTATTH
jgi:hypothetical protein